MRLMALLWLFTGNNVRNAAQIFRNFILWGFTAVPIPNLAKVKQNGMNTWDSKLRSSGILSAVG